MSLTYRLLSFLVLAAFLHGTRSCAQTLSPFSDFATLTPGELASLQVKITYLGPSDSPIPTLALTSTQNTLDLGVFVPYRRAGFESAYGSDSWLVTGFAVTAGRLQAMIDSVGTLPGVVDGGVDSSGYVSFAMIKTVGGTKAFESIVGYVNGEPLMREIAAAFAGDAQAQRLVREEACILALNGTDTPENVTARVVVEMGGFRRIPNSNTYVARVRITNTSSAPLPSPLTFVPGLEGVSVDIEGKSGYTCSIGPGSIPYLDLPVPAAGLAPGSSVEAVLRVVNPDNQAISLSPLVFAGSGTR